MYEQSSQSARSRCFVSSSVDGHIRGFSEDGLSRSLTLMHVILLISLSLDRTVFSTPHTGNLPADFCPPYLWSLDGIRRAVGGDQGERSSRYIRLVFCRFRRILRVPFKAAAAGP